MSDEKDFELTDKELDGVAGGYMIASFATGQAVAAVTNKKTGEEDMQRFEGPDATQQACEYAEKNLKYYGSR